MSLMFRGGLYYLLLCRLVFSYYPRGNFQCDFYRLVSIILEILSLKECYRGYEAGLLRASLDMKCMDFYMKFAARLISRL